jgi:multiple sugar transport system permease protein
LALAINGRKRLPIWQWLGPMAPALSIMVLFIAGPIIWSVYIAFTNKALTGVGAAHAKWVGFLNFTHMFNDPLFIKSLLLTAIFVLGSAVVGQNTLGFLIALLERGRNKFVTTTLNGFIMCAWVMPEIVAAFCWYAYLYQGGTLDAFLAHLGLSQDWLYTTPMLAIIIANIWRGTAFSMLVYSAGLSDLPSELLEAAKVDGASQLALLRRVIIPLMRRSIMVNLMLITLQTLQSFTLIFILTAGGPGEASMTTPLYIYQQAFQLYDISYGSAMCLVLLLLGAAFSLIYIKFIKVEEVAA